MMPPPRRESPESGALMEMLACPRCGSEFFLIFTDAGGRIVLQIDANRRAVIVRTEQQLVDLAAGVLQRLSCGACSWRGSADALVESRM